MQCPCMQSRWCQLPPAAGDLIGFVHCMMQATNHADGTDKLLLLPSCLFCAELWRAGTVARHTLQSDIFTIGSAIISFLVGMDLTSSKHTLKQLVHGLQEIEVGPAAASAASSECMLRCVMALTGYDAKCVLLWSADVVCSRITVGRPIQQGWGGAYLPLVELLKVRPRAAIVRKQQGLHRSLLPTALSPAPMSCVTHMLS